MIKYFLLTFTFVTSNLHVRYRSIALSFIFWSILKQNKNWHQ